jgi:hypothetical protein
MLTGYNVGYAGARRLTPDCKTTNEQAKACSTEAISLSQGFR